MCEEMTVPGIGIGKTHAEPILTAIVKDYSTPAIELGLAAWTDVQGRRWIILRGGNRGVVATSVR
jgi:hypothetical protein